MKKIIIILLSIAVTACESFVPRPIIAQRLSPRILPICLQPSKDLSISIHQRIPTRRNSKNNSANVNQLEGSKPPRNNYNQLDSVLSKLTSAFPLFVLSAAILGAFQPSTLQWVNQGNVISVMLASVMCGTGVTLERKDFEAVNWRAVPLGVACQFCCMPLAAAVMGRGLKGIPNVGNALFLGICLVGSSPGGTASNLVSLIAQADVALSVILTACSTLLAVVATPLLVKLLVGSSISISGIALMEATARVVLLPVLIGMFLNAKAPKLAAALARFTPFGSVLLVSLICGGVVAQNVPMLLKQAAVDGWRLPLSVSLAVCGMHTLGFALGYFIPKFGFGQNERSSRTISIEVGMQNSALAVVLARSLGACPLASLPGALSATAHSCLGSMLAAYWRIKGPGDSRTAVDEDDAYSI
jgi:BASS family bile acid:Na+ symporter